MVTPPLMLGAVEELANRFLRLDPDSPHYLKPLAGKVIEIDIKHLDLTIYCCPNHDDIQLLDHFNGEPDTTMTGSVSAFIAMSLSDSPLSFLTNGDVTIEGDLDTGRKFQALFDRFEPELEEWLSGYTGDVIAHEIGNFARSGKKWVQQLLTDIRLDMSEYLQHESRQLPSQPEVRYFFDKVDTLRADNDRLQVRIKRLETALNDNPPE